MARHDEGQRADQERAYGGPFGAFLRRCFLAAPAAGGQAGGAKRFEAVCVGETMAMVVCFKDPGPEGTCVYYYRSRRAPTVPPLSMVILRGFGPDETVGVSRRAWAADVALVEVSVHVPSGLDFLDAGARAIALGSSITAPGELEALAALSTSRALPGEAAK